MFAETLLRISQLQIITHFLLSCKLIVAIYPNKKCYKVIKNLTKKVYQINTKKLQKPLVNNYKVCYNIVYEIVYILFSF